MDRNRYRAIIRDMQIPARVRNWMRWVVRCVRWMVMEIVALVRRHSALLEMMALGGLIALLFSHVPGVGHVLAWMAVVLSTFVGLIREVDGGR